MAGANEPVIPPTPGPLPAGLGRDELVAEVERALAPIPEAATVVIALSGGPDSTALAYLVPEARPDLEVVLGHVRHGLRDDARDLRVVEWHARVLDLPLAVVEVTVSPQGQGIEAAARAQRYAALRRIGRQHGAGWLIVGHTADDQAETVLLRMARGTGLTGLAAMSQVRGDVVRPLLRLRRSDVHRFILHEGLEVAMDPGNDDPAFRRNVVRQRVLPTLAEVTPDPVAALARLADLAREDAGRLDEEAREIAASVFRRYGSARAVRVDVLLAQHPALSRRLVRNLIGEVRVGDRPSAADVQAVLRLHPGAGVDLPGVRVTCGGGWIAAAPPEGYDTDASTFQIPGSAPWSALRAEIVASTQSGSPIGEEPQLQLDLEGAWLPPKVVVPDELLPPGGDPRLGQVVLGPLEPGQTSGPTLAQRAGSPRGREPQLTVRTRAPGDRIRTRAGTKKLQDVFVDAGVPRAVRDACPVVLYGERVIWVPGVAVDAEFEADGIRHPAVHLAVLPPGARAAAR